MSPTRHTFTARVAWAPEKRTDGERTVRGHAAVFGEVADLGSFTEEIAPGAFRRVLARSSTDPFLLMGHDTDAILARHSAGTLAVSEDDRGLAFTADLVATNLGDDVLELVRTRHLSTCSFAFTIAADGDEWRQRNGSSHRVIREIGELYELTLTGVPAYVGTDVRSLKRKVASRGPLRVRERSAYGPDSEHSWFRDFATTEYERLHQHRRVDLELQVGRLGRALPPPLFGELSERSNQGGLAEARKRLSTVERRDVTTADPGAGVFLPASGSMPAYVADEFSAAARAEATLLASLRTLPLPRAGMTVTVPRLATGATVAVQAAENDAVSETDIDGASQAAAVAYVAGRQDMSRQALERALPRLDEVLARDLGRALGAAIDAQLVSGSNASGQTLGLATVTGIKTVTYTDASPTAQELVAQTWKAYNEIATAGYGVADPSAYRVVLHPRRLAFAYNNAQGSQSIDPRFPGGQPIPSRGIRATLGAGTDEDEVFVLLRDELPIFLDPPRFQLDENVLSGTLQVRFVVYQALASGFGRSPEAICRVSGTGLIAPTL